MAICYSGAISKVYSAPATKLGSKLKTYCKRQSGLNALRKLNLSILLRGRQVVYLLDYGHRPHLSIEILHRKCISGPVVPQIWVLGVKNFSSKKKSRS